MKNNYLMTVILVVVFAAVGFYGGTLYQKNQASSNNIANGLGGGAGGRFGGTGGVGRRNGGGQVIGTILTQNSSSMTVKLADGSSKIVLLSSSTSFNKSAPAAVSDLKVGDRVAVFGAANSDGSVNATNVQLNPIQRMGGGRLNGSGPTGATGGNSNQ
jgi:hypothetical protein